MRKILLLSAMVLSLSAFQASAETVQGKVKSNQGNQLVVMTDNGQQMNMTTTDNTTYRKKKMKKHKKGKNVPNQEMAYFMPVAEEDDWVEVTYNPETGKSNEYLVQDVVIYDD